MTLEVKHESEQFISSAATRTRPTCRNTQSASFSYLQTSHSVSPLTLTDRLILSAAGCRFGTEYAPDVPGRDFTPEAPRPGDVDLGHLRVYWQTVRPVLRTQVLKGEDSWADYSCVCVCVSPDQRFPSPLCLSQWDPGPRGAVERPALPSGLLLHGSGGRAAVPARSPQIPVHRERRRDGLQKRSMLGGKKLRCNCHFIFCKSINLSVVAFDTIWLHADLNRQTKWMEMWKDMSENHNNNKAEFQATCNQAIFSFHQSESN